MPISGQPSGIRQQVGRLQGGDITADWINKNWRGEFLANSCFVLYSNRGEHHVMNADATHGDIGRHQTLSELYMELYPDAPFVHTWQVGVCESSYVIHAQHLENVLDT